ncbi:SpoIIE family protein phosphatase [Streptomyces sp. TLI_105]|uniref:SpoIIE family protein phosphatase n=1 Tax=Streptomyces sp. TLI_105 TaxID=1881019 RepID=UPI00089771D6|nr:SpoIIE family protein phosphatase [Streptomyces sp. TLI_105]SEC00141.1 PAS domain S-box-containing protein [Streptomyces sp. TLI_105]
MTTPGAGEQYLGTPFSLGAMATAVLDHGGEIIGWDAAAEDLYGYPAEEVLGRPARTFLVPVDGRTLFAPDRPIGSWGEKWALRKRDGSVVHVVLYVLRLGPAEARPTTAAWGVVSVEAGQMERWATDQAMLAGLSTQSPISLTVIDADARVQWVNPATEAKFGIGREDYFGLQAREILPHGEFISPGPPGRSYESVIDHVLRTGEPVIDLHYRSSLPGDPPTRRHVWSCSYFRLQDATGHHLGVCESAFEITARYEALRRLELLSRSSGIGTTLDGVRTCEELVAAVVPDLADAARVDLAESVLAGEEPGPWSASTPCRRVTGGNSAGHDGAPGGEFPAGGRQLVLPLTAGAARFGTVTLLRTARRDPFTDADRALAAELVAHTAVCVDNGRRYARERATALLFQRNLLPQELPEHTAVEAAHHYVPGAGPTGVGGDWYDVIPLSGARVGLVVGDVVGHGLHAAVTMGRLRTTVRALAALDLAPEELLSRLDDLVGQARIGLDPKETDGTDPAVGARCLYLVYDAVHGRCAAASAGHLPPVLVAPGGPAAPLEMPVGLPLGVGGLPFESAEFAIAEDSLLALFTDGLVTGADHDPDTGITGLCRMLSEHQSLPPIALRDRVVASGLPADTRDDAALLLVRVHALAEDHMAGWRIDPDPAKVAGARASTNAQLEHWGLDAVGFAVELIVSELVTNAIRYGAPPVDLRLLRDKDRALICEVSDSRETSPHLRRARPDEEGGRGLFLVAQLADHWGTRYTREGKTIWAEVPIGADDGGPDPFGGVFGDVLGE